MSERTNHQFLDIKKWLQDKLDEIVPDYFKVSNERNIDSDFIEGEVVASALSGTPYEDSANIPYQFDIYTADIDFVMNALNNLTSTVSNVPFDQILSIGVPQPNSGPVFTRHRITPYLNTPVVMDKDIENGSQHYARIVIFANMLVFYDINDIKKLEIDSEEINLLSSSINYTIEPVSSRASGQELTLSKKKSSAFSISFSMVNKSNCLFANKAFGVATGQLPGNTPFTTKITLDSGISVTKSMFIGNYVFAKDRGKLPSINVSMYLFDTRGN